MPYVELDDILNGTVEDRDREKNRDKNNNRDDRDNENRGDRRDKNFKKGSKGNPNISWIYSGERPKGQYDRDDIVNILVKHKGLIKIIKDLKKNKDEERINTIYITNAIRDIIFAAALPEALKRTFFNDEYEFEDGIKKKDIQYLLDELLRFINCSNKVRERLVSQYGEESVVSMKSVYMDIILKSEKKKTKKLEKIIADQDVTRKIVLLTTGTIDRSIYYLIKYLYTIATDDEYVFSKKKLIKIFKACYGKECMPDVAKYLMLEDTAVTSGMADEVSVTLDEIWMETLNDLPRSQIEKILKDYVKIRRRQERTPSRPRRLGNRKGIHPDDYKKLVKSFESIESKDISSKQWFR